MMNMFVFWTQMICLLPYFYQRQWQKCGGDIVYTKTEWITDQGIIKTNYSDKKAHCVDYDVSTEERNFLS